MLSGDKIQTMKKRVQTSYAVCFGLWVCLSVEVCAVVARAWIRVSPAKIIAGWPLVPCWPSIVKLSFMSCCEKGSLSDR